MKPWCIWVATLLSTVAVIFKLIHRGGGARSSNAGREARPAGIHRILLGRCVAIEGESAAAVGDRESEFANVHGGIP